jgi:hypothetical protein
MVGKVLAEQLNHNNVVILLLTLPMQLGDAVHPGESFEHYHLTFQEVDFLVLFFLHLYGNVLFRVAI